MTVAALPSKKDYIENGVTLSFAVPFRFLPGSIVATRVMTSGAVAVLLPGVDFTTSGGSTDAGGTLVLASSVAGARLRIRRSTSRVQGMDYTAGDRFPAESHEAALDRAMLVDQEQDAVTQEYAARALLVPDGEAAPPLQSKADRAGKFPMWSADGSALLSSYGNAGDDAGLRQDLATPDGPAMLGGPDGGTLEDLLPRKGPSAISGARAGLTYRYRRGATNLPDMGGYWSTEIYGEYNFELLVTNATHPVGIPDRSPAWALGAYVESDGADINAVGFMSIAKAIGHNSKVFAVNFIATGAADLDNCVFVVAEFDLQAPLTSPPAPGSAGSYYVAFHPDSGNAIQINGGGGGSFSNGVVVYDVAPGGTGFAGGAGGYLPSLSNSGAANYIDDAHILQSGHAIRFYGAGGNYATLGCETGLNTLTMRLPGMGAFAVKSPDFSQNYFVVDANGNAAVGPNANVGGGFKLDVATTVTTEMIGLGRYSNSAGVAAGRVYTANGTAPNAASATFLLRANSSTGRSINAGGTINASGADYAEYERKRDDCGPISKGQIIGFDADGLLTDRFADAISFAVKSTNPNLVGGDDCMADLPPHPEMPVFDPPAYAGAPHPGPSPEKVERAPYERDDKGKIINNAYNAGVRETFAAASRVAKDAYEAAKAAFHADRAAWEALVAEQKTHFDLNEMVAYQDDVEDWEALYDETRAPFDRIAYEGKVPVNVSATLPIGTVLDLIDGEGRPYQVTIAATGAVPGDFIIAVADGAGISAEARSYGETSPEERDLFCVGRVRSILPDGRAQIVVKAV